MRGVVVTARRARSALIALALAAGSALADLQTLAPEQAGDHIGEHATVCGVVADAAYRADVNGAPTFLNFGGAHPRQVFTALIWGEHRARFTSPPETHVGESICVTGRVSAHRGKPQIVVDSPAQIVPGGPR